MDLLYSTHPPSCFPIIPRSRWFSHYTGPHMSLTVPSIFTQNAVSHQKSLILFKMADKFLSAVNHFILPFCLVSVYRCNFPTTNCSDIWWRVVVVVALETDEQCVAFYALFKFDHAFLTASTVNIMQYLTGMAKPIRYLFGFKCHHHHTLRV